MTSLEKDALIVVDGGGSGPISIEDELLNVTEYIYSIVGVHDGGGKRGGGHSRLIRTVVGTLPPGDATHRIAVHIRHPEVRKLFTHRWALGQGNRLNGHRPSNELLAAAEYIQGKVHSEGIKLIEEAFKAHYIGRVIPVSDDNFHLRAILANGKHIDGEGAIDTRRSCYPPIVDFAFIPNPIIPNASPIHPKPNHEAVKTIREATIFVDPPGSEISSRKPSLRILRGSIQQSNAIIIKFVNAFTNYSETHGYTASTFTQNFFEEVGVKPHFTFVNMPDHEIPQAYEAEKSYRVEADIESCRPFTERVYGLPATELCNIDGKLVVRHNGKLATELIVGIANGKRVESILNNLGISYVS